MTSFAFIGCDSSEDAEDAAAEESGDAAPKDEYEQYIRSELESVNGKSPSEAAKTATPEQITEPLPTQTGTDDDFYVSSMENPDTQDPFSSDDLTATPTPTDDAEADGSPTPTPTPYITPDEFDVGTCCIYINGETDSAYGTEVMTAINKARTDLGYKPLVTNTGLSTCADRRTREIAADLNHTRPNGLPFYSLAPEYFKAEMLIINNQKAEDAVDTMIKMDPVSRNLIFTTKYQSIGASSFKCNGRQCTVVSFGL